MALFYQSSFALDSLTNVKGFSSSIDGKTYGLKKEGGIFIPADVPSSDSVISGIIPNTGLYLDGAQRLGTLVPEDSSVFVGSSGLDVKYERGLTKSATGALEAKIGEGLEFDVNYNIDVKPKTDGGLFVTPDGIAVLVDGPLKVDSYGVGLKYTLGIILRDDAIRIGNGYGLTFDGANFLTLDLGPGLFFPPGGDNKVAVDIGPGLTLSGNKIVPNVDNSTITIVNNLLTANATSSSFGSTKGYDYFRQLRVPLIPEIVEVPDLKFNLPAGYCFTSHVSFKLTLFSDREISFNDGNEIVGEWINSIDSRALAEDDFGFLLGQSRGEPIVFPAGYSESYRKSSSYYANTTGEEMTVIYGIGNILRDVTLPDILCGNIKAIINIAPITV